MKGAKLLNPPKQQNEHEYELIICFSNDEILGNILFVRLNMQY